MPPKKIIWGDVPNIEYVGKKNENNGRWIECSLCFVVIKVRIDILYTYFAFMKMADTLH